MTSRRFKRERKRSRPPMGVPCERPNRFKQAFAVEMDRVRYFMGPTTEDMPTLKRLRWEFAEAGVELESPINIGVN